jgi:phosphotransferase system enzyme I (PtsI)
MDRKARERAEGAAGPAITRDGHAILLLANIEVPEDAPMALASGAQGIGLYRTEFFYLKGRTLPDEEGQYRAYRSIAQRLRPFPVTIRTLDAGGDKFAEYLGTKRESNPFLGLRGIRFSLTHPEIFRTQLRAVLRATAHGHVRVLLPMISSLEEVRAARVLLREAAEELRREGRAMAERIECGAMIEVPAAVALADLLAREVDFFSIGSNDLIQYTLAVDRANRDVVNLYNPSDPAVLRLISMTLTAAARKDCPVSLCGQMCGNPLYTMLLLGMGLRRLSVSPGNLPEIKKVCRSVTIARCETVAQRVLEMENARDVKSYLNEELNQHVPHWHNP